MFLNSAEDWDVTPCGSYSSPILVTLKMEALGSSEMSVLIRATRRNITEYGFFIVTAVKTSNLIALKSWAL
jgi:hypothetical protein